jgi:hypothetical protein
MQFVCCTLETWQQTLFGSVTNFTRLQPISCYVTDRCANVAVSVDNNNSSVQPYINCLGTVKFAVQKRVRTVQCRWPSSELGPVLTCNGA